jgi:cation diffusion facilitator family transporter
MEGPDGSLEAPASPAEVGTVEVGTVEGAGAGALSPGKPAVASSVHDHNLRSAYLHVLADALTSVLAILSLLAGRFLGLSWMDPAMGIVGAVLVANWAVGLVRLTARVLLDRQAHEPILHAVKESIESRQGDRVADLHVWCIGPGIHAAVISVVADRPLSPEGYRERLPTDLGLVHVTVEVHDAAREPGGSSAAGGAASGPVAS